MPDKLGRILEPVGEGAVFVFGVQVLLGALVGKLKDVTYSQLREAIENNTDLPLDQLEDYREMASKINLDRLTPEAIMKRLRRVGRFDLVNAIENTPGGYEWLERQIAIIKEKLQGS